jgi:hypothetical protein
VRDRVHGRYYKTDVVTSGVTVEILSVDSVLELLEHPYPAPLKSIFNLFP